MGKFAIWAIAIDYKLWVTFGINMKTKVFVKSRLVKRLVKLIENCVGAWNKKFDHLWELKMDNPCAIELPPHNKNMVKIFICILV